MASIEPPSSLDAPTDPSTSYTFGDPEVSQESAGNPDPDTVDENVPKSPPVLQTEVNEAQEDDAGDKPETDKTSAPPSPTASVSSLSSSESTSKLINSLSMNSVALLKPEKDESGQVRTITKKYEEYSEKKEEYPPRANPKDGACKENVGKNVAENVASDKHIVVSPVLPKPVPKSVPAETLSKKPIKFTVRKVSRDEAVCPKRSEPRKEYLYGNIPENRAKLELRKANDKKTQLSQSQETYDSYVVRSDKIEKEIRFLTNLLPPYNVEIDYATRTKITRAIEKLRMKKDEIEKKKYSLGISISRLWREYDENSTWVRSVSNQ